MNSQHAGEGQHGAPPVDGGIAGQQAGRALCADQDYGVAVLGVMVGLASVWFMNCTTTMTTMAETMTVRV